MRAPYGTVVVAWLVVIGTSAALAAAFGATADDQRTIPEQRHADAPPS